MNQKLLVRRDELVHTYQLDTFIQEIASRQFWQSGRLKAINGCFIVILIFSFIYTIYIGKGVLDEGALTGLLVVDTIMVSSALLSTLGLGLLYLNSSGWVYVYTHGLIYLQRKRQFVVRWEQLSEVSIRSGLHGASWLHIELNDGTNFDFDGMWFDIKALTSVIQSTRYRYSGARKG